MGLRGKCTLYERRSYVLLAFEDGHIEIVSNIIRPQCNLLSVSLPKTISILKSSWLSFTSSLMLFSLLQFLRVIRNDTNISSITTDHSIDQIKLNTSNPYTKLILLKFFLSLVKQLTKKFSQETTPLQKYCLLSPPLRK